MQYNNVRYDELFKVFVEFDTVYANAINTQMCTDFCICPGLPTDDHYKAYSEVPAEEYAKYNRTWNVGFDGSISFDRDD